MSDGSESDRLLNDVLAEIAPASFRAELLGRALRDVRRRRHQRQWNRVIAVIALILAAGWFGWRIRGPARQVSAPETGWLRIVSSAPLHPAMIVTSTAGSATIISSSPSSIAFVATKPSTHDLHELNDEELLGLMAGKPSVLVRQGPHQAELLIVDAAHDGAYPAGLDGNDN